MALFHSPQISNLNFSLVVLCVIMAKRVGVMMKGMKNRSIQNNQFVHHAKLGGAPHA